MLRAIVLAAGASSRMGRPKSALPVPGAADPGDTFLRHLGNTLLRAGLPQIAIVTGAAPLHAREAWPVSDPRVRFVQNDAWEEGQLSSLRHGILSVSAPELEAVLVALVDVPLVSRPTVQRLIEVWRRRRPPIVRPSHGGVHGHPVIFDCVTFDDLLTADLPEGAKTIVHAHHDQVVNVEVDDRGAFLDFDTPSDLRAGTGRTRGPG